MSFVFRQWLFKRNYILNPISLLQKRFISFQPKSKYGGRQTITCIPGLGDSAMIMHHVRSFLIKYGAPIDFEMVDLNYIPTKEELEQKDDDLAYAVTTIRRNGAAIIGYLDITQMAGLISLRNKLNLHSSITYVKNYPGTKTRHKNIDVVIVFQNMEGEFLGLEHEVKPGVVEMIRAATENNYRKVAITAFEYAKVYGRKTVHAVHNARRLPMVEGLFLKVIADVSKDYDNILLETIACDEFMSKFNITPEKYDVVCCANAYGSGILSMACGIGGGTGLFSTINYGNEFMVFEPAARLSHIGAHFENPIALLNASASLLYFLGYE